ncbi:MAG: glycosyltransferase [Chloroflexota bacterium]
MQNSADTRLAFISLHSSPLARTGGKDTGGMNIYVKELSRELGKRGSHVDIFTRCTDPSLPQMVNVSENVRLIHVKSGAPAELEKEHLFSHLPEFLYNVRRFVDLEGTAYSLVHSHYWLSAWIGRALQQEWGIPHVAMFHTLGEVKNRARAGENETELRIGTERAVIASADYVVAPSLSERSQLLRLYEAVPQRIEVVPCGVDTQQFRPTDKVSARGELGFCEAQLILFVGRIEPLKGIDLLLKAVGSLTDTCNLRVILIGGDYHSSAEIERLRQIAEEQGIGQKVDFLGAIEHEKLPLYYNAANVCVVPSYYESFGMAALEALACGTPVIASRVGGLDDIVQDGQTGYLIPWHCPEPFAERLELLLGNERLQQVLGKAGHAFAQSFAWPAITDRIVSLYERALSHGNKVEERLASCQTPGAP